MAGGIGAGGQDATLLPLVQSMTNDQIDEYIDRLQDEWQDLQRQIREVNRALQICEDVMWARDAQA